MTATLRTKNDSLINRNTRSELGACSEQNRGLTSVLLLLEVLLSYWLIAHPICTAMYVTITTGSFDVLHRKFPKFNQVRQKAFRVPENIRLEIRVRPDVGLES